MKLSEIEQRYRARLQESFADPQGGPAPQARIEELVRQAEEELVRARAKAQRLVEAAESEAREAARRVQEENRAQLRAERRRLVGQQLKGRELLRVIELRAEEEGRSRGRATGRVEAVRESAELRRRATRALEALEDAAREVRAERERRAVELACRLVETCLGLPPAGLPELYRAAFTRLLGAGPGSPDGRLRIACHPDLAGFLRNLGPIGSGRVELESDPSAPPDRVRVFDRDSVLELSPQARLAELETALRALAGAGEDRGGGSDPSVPAPPDEGCP